MHNGHVPHQALTIPRKKYPNTNTGLLARMFDNEGFSTVDAGRLANVLSKILDRQAMDEQLNYDYIERNVPAGYMTHAAVTAAQGGITAIADLTNLSVTWHSLENRRYKITAKVEVYTSVADGGTVLSLTDASNNLLQRAPGVFSATAPPITLSILYIETGTGEELTRKLRLEKNGGTGNVTSDAGATYPAILLVEDIGPA